MKKTFKLTSDNKPLDRHIQTIKSDIKKYIARERRKELPEEFDHWAFDCKFGNTENDAKTVFANELRTLVDKSAAESKPSFYVEILSRPAKGTGNDKPKKKDKTKK